MTTLHPGRFEDLIRIRLADLHRQALYGRLLPRPERPPKALRVRTARLLRALARRLEPGDAPADPALS